MGFFSLSDFVNQFPPTRFPLLTAIGMCHFLPVHHLGIAFFGRFEGQNTTLNDKSYFSGMISWENIFWISFFLIYGYLSYNYYFSNNVLSNLYGLRYCLCYSVQFYK